MSGGGYVRVRVYTCAYVHARMDSAPVYIRTYVYAKWHTTDATANAIATDKQLLLATAATPLDQCLLTRVRIHRSACLCVAHLFYGGEAAQRASDQGGELPTRNAPHG